MLPPEIIEKIRKERDEKYRQPSLEIPLPSPEIIHNIDDISIEPEETTGRVFIIELGS